MRIKTNIYFILFMLISFLASYLLIVKMLIPDEAKTIKTFVISSGSEGGNYHKAGSGIAEELNQISTKKYSFKSVSSNGSLENIKRLKSRYADFAIVQRDELIKSYHDDSNGSNVKNISVIAPLFQEKLLIYTHAKNNIPFNKFKNQVSQSSVKIKVGVTTKSGTAYKTFKEASNLLSLTTENIEFVEGNYTELINEFNSKSIDYLLTFSLPLEEVEKTNAGLIYFSDKNILQLTSRMRQFSPATISNSRKQQTLGVWALLIGLNNSIEAIGDKNILNRLTKSNNDKNHISTQIKSTLTLFKTETTMFDEYLSTLSNSPSLVNRIKKVSPYNYFNLIPIIVILLSAVYIYKVFLDEEKKKWRLFWIRYKHIFLGVTTVTIFYLLCIEFLIYHEEIFFKSTGVKSRILDLPKTDLHIWNAFRIFAQVDDGIFPYSIYGKLVTALSTYLTLFGTIAIFLSEFLMAKWTAKRRSGKMKIQYKNHVIISGWNHSSMELIEDLLAASKEYHNKEIKIVCVVPETTSILKNHPNISDLEHLGQVTFVQGDIRNNEVALQCNAYFASSIIFTAEDTSINADEKTLLRALSITKFNRRQREEQAQVSNSSLNEIFKSHKTKTNINTTYLIAEINNEEFVDDLRNAGVNGIVNRGQITKNILIQSLLNPGVSVLLNNVLSFSHDTNEFYTVDLRDDANKHLRFKTFDELLLPLRKQRILLIAIKVIYLDEAGELIVDIEELDKLLKLDNLNRQIITNPISEIETNRMADDDDHLIVLAPSTAELKKGLAKLTF